MKKKIWLLFLTGLILSVTLGVGKSISEKQKIFINEVRSYDASVKRDGDYGSDYIELYNASRKAISLDGWYLSDDESDLKKCRMEDVVIEAGGWTVLYANGENDCADSLSFKINAEGEKLFLSDTDGKLVDSVYVPALEFGTVYARLTDGAEEWVIQEETTAMSNDGAARFPARILKEPVFSHESGFYEDAFTLTLEAGAGETIYYTLDGSVPTEDSFVYEDGITIENRSDEPNVINSVRNIRKDWLTYGLDETPVDKAVIVRAVAMDQNHCASEVITKTYFVGLELYEEQNVISVVAEFDDLFGDEGIFVTGKEYDDAYLSGTLDDSIEANIFKKGRNWEIVGNLQFFQEKNEVINQKIGLRTKGASSRAGKKKRIGFYARKEYSGSPYIENLQFDGREVHSFFTQTGNANALLQGLLKDREVAIQSAKQAAIFLNGEFYYTGYLLEQYDKYYLEDRYGVNPDNVMIVKANTISEGPELSDKFYAQVSKYAEEHDLSVPENYEKLLTKMDMQSFIDYMCANAYFCNMDMAEHKNYMVWRTIENEGTDMGDTRWRWMIYDVDCITKVHPEVYGVERKFQIDSFSKVMETTGKALNEHPIFKASKANEGFCKQFVLTFLDMANVNFSVDHVQKTFEKWNTTLDEYDEFFKNRFDYIVPYMAKEFELTGTLETVTLEVNDSEGGTIQLNTTTPDLTTGSWSGKYYTDYPVQATAVPAEGYEFVGWSGNVTSEELSVEAEVLKGGIKLKAVFEKSVQ